MEKIDPITHKLKLPRAVIFDWDNTLVDNWGAITEGMNAALTDFGSEAWSIEQVKYRCNRALRDSFPEWFGSKWERARDLFYKRFQEVQMEYLSPLSGANELLSWLGEQKVPLFVVTNKRGDIMRLEAEKLGWADRFVAMIGSLDASCDKPEREPVDLALSKAGMTADDSSIWFVGDKKIDVDCARNSGCTPVLVYNENEAIKSNVELSFSDCHELLRCVSDSSTCQQTNTISCDP